MEMTTRNANLKIVMLHRSPRTVIHTRGKAYLTENLYMIAEMTEVLNFLTILTY